MTDGGSTGDHGTSDSPGLLEQIGVRYLRDRSEEVALTEEDDDVHLLDEQELDGLRWIQRWTVIRAAIVGALSALASALAELWARPLLGADPEAASLGQSATFWAVVLGVTGVATLFEIGFLYLDSLRSVHRLTRVAGLRLFPEGPRGPASAVATALARAALELPNPPDSGGIPIDPHRETNKLVMITAALLYKTKIGLTSFLAKALLRRLLGRALVRVWLVFVAVPVTAAWNAIVAFIVIREARLRAMGPSAARSSSTILLSGQTLSPAARLAARRAVAACIVRTHDMHPNLVAMLHEVSAHVADHEPGDLDDTAALLAQLAGLREHEQGVVLGVLVVSSILDGKVSRPERALVREALTVCGRAPDTRPLTRLRRRFESGKPLGKEHIDAVLGR